MATEQTVKKGNKKRRKSTVLTVALSIVGLGLLSVVAAVLITNNGKLDLDGLGRLFSSAGSRETASVFVFDTAADKDVAAFDGGVAVAATGGLQVVDRYGDTTFEETYGFTAPTVVTVGNHGAAYDLGGERLVLFDTNGIVKALTAPGRIISACLNKNGWLALCTQESGYRGLVTVYNARGEEAYEWFSAKGYTLSAEVSPNNAELAALTLSDEGSRIVFFSLDDDTGERASAALGGELVTQMTYINKDSVLAASEKRLVLIGSDGGSETAIDYAGKYLAGYTLQSPEFTALVLSDYLVGDQGSLVTADRSGRTLGTMTTGSKVLALSAGGDYLAVLYSDGLVLYNKDLEEYARFGDTAGVIGIIMRADGTALSITAHSATVRKAAAD